MSKVIPIYRIYDLPWTAGGEQERRFHTLLRRTALTVLVLALVLTFLPVPDRDELAVPEIPPRLARLVLEQAPPPPPPPVVEPEPEPVPEATPEPEQPVVAETPPAPEPLVPEPAPEPEPPPVDQTQVARERASVAGLLPFAAELQALRDVDAVDRLDRTEIGAVGETDAPSERSLITANAGSRSGGISTAALSRNTGGSGLAGRATTQVDSPVAGFGVEGGAAERTGGDSNRASRSREEIERVFDLNKGAIYALYNRALRQDPTLQGKLVLRLTITPDGRVTSCEVVSSELGDPDLEQKLVQRVLLFQFEAKNVEAITTTKPIDFFPA